MLRSLGAATAFAVAILAIGSTAAADPAPRPSGDYLTVTVVDSGESADGTFELFCNPAGGNHRTPEEACAKLTELTRWGTDPFAPVPPDAQCTMQYGGPATARIAGTWAGRPVDAEFRRTNGCEISRWAGFEPVLPHTPA
jgi:hypothetical protein